MANPSHVEMLYQGAQRWNQWRKDHTEFRPNLIGAYLPGIDLAQADLRSAYLSQANLSGANLLQANLAGANLSQTDLAGVLQLHFQPEQQ